MMVSLYIYRDRIKLWSVLCGTQIARCYVAEAIILIQTPSIETDAVIKRSIRKRSVGLRSASVIRMSF